MTRCIAERLTSWLLSGLAVAACFAPATATAGGLIELTEHGKKHQGKLEAKGSDLCWLMGRDGKLSSFEIGQIDSVRSLNPRFREYSVAELRDQLRREMPKTYRIDATAHFLVCAEKNNRKFGDICEDTYRMFHRYFSVRGFKISEPEFPLVVIVFPERSSFIEYCRQDGITPPNGLLGYYMRLSNRIALFDTGEKTSTAALQGGNEPERPGAPFGEMAAARIDKTIEGSLHNTMVHETIHQVAFNTGLHARLGDTPKWVIEGLATMFEAPGIRDAQKSTAAKTRINRDRYLWFMNYRKNRRPARALDEFVSSDDLYNGAALDAYSEGWALTFFLAETRHASYVRYLKAIVQRAGQRPYDQSERLAEFRRAFGDVKSLETDYLRFYDNLK